MSDSRLKNTAKNTFTGLLNQIAVLLFNFISKTIFIHCLGTEFLGINGLFTNILQVLTIAELGFGTAMSYSMYKPIAENDEKTLAALINFYKKMYNIIAITITVIGVALIPVLPYIVNTEKEIEHLTLYYILYLLNTVMSYLFAYKTAITIAHQKSYILNNYDSLFTIIQSILQIIFLILTKNFTMYLIIQVLCTLLKNICKAKKSQSLYPYIKSNEQLDKSEKHSIFNNVKSMFIYRLGGVLLNNTDNIIISILVGTISVGLYSNYLMIINAINSFINIFFSSMTASVGNLNATSNEKEQYEYFERINFLSIWIFSFCGICVFSLINDFVLLWLGEEFIFDQWTLIAIVLNLVIPGTTRTIALYRDTLGMFNDTKYVFFVTSVLNCIFSVILGKQFGIAGILFATSLSRLLTNMWYEPYILFKNYLKKSPFQYFKKQVIYWIVFIVNLIITNSSADIIFKENNILLFIIKILYCVVVSNLIMILVYHKSPEFKFYLKLVKNIFNTKIKRV